ncbi:glycosyltransferase family 4 protein [Aestuariivivens sediminis]|uniref:glycosyltransferase family 4 protein n=1 Tax=Aestuariivivens sediminis TaxID=2913557 RepID=UPI001F586E51|nr:glycosyltransferase family 4 protein [Aestuariivivens sediminis]
MKLLFITHNSNRAGAPKVLLLFLQWLKFNTDYEFDVLDMCPGDLQNDFKNVSKSYYVWNPKKKYNPNVLAKTKAKLLGSLLQDNKAKTFKEICNTPYDLIYCNTVKSIPLGSLLKQELLKSKLFVHIHELSIAIKLMLPNISDYVNDIDHVIAVSEIVEAQLISLFAFDQNKISRVYAFSNFYSKTLTTRIKKQAFRIGASGTIDWRKGADIFLQVAYKFFKYQPNSNIEFNWVGSISSTDRLILENDIEKMGLHQKVRFVGELADPFSQYESFDIFLLTSREDPFPLVGIEVGQLGIPIICFKGAVGTEEVLKKGGGKLVPYLDVDEMVEAILHYLEHPQQRISDGQLAKELFAPFTVDKQAPKLLDVINKNL